MSHTLAPGYYLHVDLAVDIKNAARFESLVTEFLNQDGFTRIVREGDDDSLKKLDTKRLVLALKSQSPLTDFQTAVALPSMIARSAAPPVQAVRYVHLWRVPDLVDLNLVRLMRLCAADSLYRELDALVLDESQDFVFRVSTDTPLVAPRPRFVRAIRRFRSKDLGAYLFNIGVLFPSLERARFSNVSLFQTVTGTINSVLEFWTTDTDDDGSSLSRILEGQALGRGFAKQFVEPSDPATRPAADGAPRPLALTEFREVLQPYLVEQQLSAARASGQLEELYGFAPGDRPRYVGPPNAPRYPYAPRVVSSASPSASSSKPRVLVVGATGSLGAEVTRLLHQGGADVRCLVRYERRAAAPPYVKVAFGDLKDPDSLQRACANVDVVVSTATATRSRLAGDSVERVDGDGQLTLVSAAEQAHVPRFVFVSFPVLGDIQFVLQDAKRAVESALRSSTMRATILQPSYYMEAWLSPDVGFDPAHGKINAFGSGRKRTNWISTDDVARCVTHAALLEAAPEGIIPLGGPQALSQMDVVNLFEGLGGPKVAVDHTSFSEAQLGRWLQNPKDSVDQAFAAATLGVARGLEVPSAPPTLVGSPLRSVKDYATTLLRESGVRLPISPAFHEARP